MKLYIALLLSLSILSCNSEMKHTDQSKQATVATVDTDYGVDPGNVSGMDSIHLNSTYINTRYGFSLSYPHDDITMESEPDSHDGCIFTADGDVELGRVYRIANADPEQGKISLKKEMNADLAYFKEEAYGHRVKDLYTKLFKTFYVASAKVDGKIYYRKGILLDGDDMAKVIFKYEVQQKAKYDVIVAAMAQSFHK
jgi:hypothetical protein